jgi:hypothetical protein
MTTLSIIALVLFCASLTFSVAWLLAIIVIYLTGDSHE